MPWTAPEPRKLSERENLFYGRLALQDEPSGFQFETLKVLPAHHPIAPVRSPRAHDHIPELQFPGDSGNSDESTGTGRFPVRARQSF